MVAPRRRVSGKLARSERDERSRIRVARHGLEEGLAGRASIGSVSPRHDGGTQGVRLGRRILGLEHRGQADPGQRGEPRSTGGVGDLDRIGVRPSRGGRVVGMQRDAAEERGHERHVMRQTETARELQRGLELGSPIQRTPVTNGDDAELDPCPAYEGVEADQGRAGEHTTRGIGRGTQVTRAHGLR